METAQLIAAVNGLQEAVTDLSKRADTTQEVLERIERLAGDTRRNRVGIQVGTIAIVLSLVVGSFAVYLFTRVNTYAHQVQQVQDRTSSEILCPLFIILNLSIQVNPAPSTMTPEQAEVRKRAGTTIATALKTLGCA